MKKEKRRRYFLETEVVCCGIFHNLKYFLLIALCFLNIRHCPLTSTRVLLPCFRGAPLQRLLSAIHDGCSESVFAPEDTVLCKTVSSTESPSRRGHSYPVCHEPNLKKVEYYFSIYFLYETGMICPLGKQNGPYILTNLILKMSISIFLRLLVMKSW